MSTVIPPTSTTAAAGLTEAWSYYQLPIFYTLQPNPPTRQKQIALWADALVQGALRQCSLAHSGTSNWEREQRGGSSTSANAGESAAAQPPLAARAVTGKLNALPNDKCPFAALYTSEDDIFVNAALNRRLPKSVIPLVFQACMLMHPNRCISNVPLNGVMRGSADDDQLYGDAAANANVSVSSASIQQHNQKKDKMGSWLSSMFSSSHQSSSSATAAAAHHQQQQQDAALRLRQQQQQQQQEEDEANSFWLVVFANDGGHTTVMTDHVMPWVMDMAGGLTTANLKKNGVITTFDEMASENALIYTPPAKEGGGHPIAISYAAAVKGMPAKWMGPASSPPSSSTSTAVYKMANGITNEHVLRLILHFYQHSVAAVPVTRITLFNLDDSDRQPYEGVKFGGEGM